ncbi:MAG: molybdopterin oxidoreductase [Bacteroidetes bacterium]|nr:MAG: molybdopterin oxidoreductase [Bacteroidota bacterium]
MANKKQYWSGLDELEGTEAFKELQGKEFPEPQSVDEFLSDERHDSTTSGRRDFLKFMGFSLTAATLAACETPVIKSIPYTNKPAEITPGVANYYASTYYDGMDYANVLVKTREGRPIFVKGNAATGIGAGKANVRVIGSVMSLYDKARLSGPTKNGEPVTWANLDSAMKAAISGAGRTVILSNTIVSPSTLKAISALGVEHIQYDAISYGALRSAQASAFGVDAIPTYDFTKAEVIVSIAADFLSSWLSSTQYAPDYASLRGPERGAQSKHYQFETAMSMTGTNADIRAMIKPSEEGKVASALLSALKGESISNLDSSTSSKVLAAAKALSGAKGKSIVIAGSNDLSTQIIVAAINQLLENYGNSIDLERPTSTHKGNEIAATQLIEDMNSGMISTLITYGCNPSYDMPNAKAFNSGLAKVKTSVCMNGVADETASRSTFVAPDHHYLESWNDLSLRSGRIDLVQPTIEPLFDTRSAQESFLVWSNAENTDWYTFLRRQYNESYTSDSLYSDSSWNSAIHDGYMSVAETKESPDYLATIDTSSASRKVAAVKGGNVELVTYVKATAGAGNHAANPMLQETPDPVSKVTWDNYVSMAKVDMEAMGLNTYFAQEDFASVVKVTVDGKSIELPAYLQPGQKPGTIGIALGYGRGANGENIGQAAFQTGQKGEHLMLDSGLPMPIGANAFPLTTRVDGNTIYANYNVSIEATGNEYPLACTQIHNTYMGRDSVVRETTFDSYLSESTKPKGEASWNMSHRLNVHEDTNHDGVIDARDKTKTGAFDLWKSHPIEEVGHRWGMTIDLTTCTGCSSCVTACNIENNVSVVGKDEVLRHRDMHWIRIDRYYASDFSLEKGEEEGVGVIDSYGRMEDPSENPQTVHMPMMCQHCNHAPCETVCPVAATTHSNEGLNQMTYNRCIGTRYCANNCPYKVRRFNWFNYKGYMKFANVNPAHDSLARLVLNPDVTVRARGVMEKCSMCIQRIQSGKLEAKKADTPVIDGAIVTACAESCPSNAITFGDLNDNGSQVRSISENNRSYHALEEIGVKPNIFYMTKVRNLDSNEA